MDDIINKIYSLKNGSGSPYGEYFPTNLQAIESAVRFIYGLKDVINKKPNVCISEKDVCLEWWGYHDRKLSLFFNKRGAVSYLKSYNEFVEDMESGRINMQDPFNVWSLFSWLYFPKTINVW